MTLLDTTAIRADFPVFEDPDLHFLDSAASSQKPRQVIEAMAEFTAHGYANVHRGAYELSVAATERYEAVRHQVAAFLGTSRADEIVFTRGTTSGLNLLAHGWGTFRLGPDDRILLTEMEHHANLVPWQVLARRTGARLEFIPLTEDFRLDLSRLDRLIDRDTKVVSVTGMSNVLGTIPDLEPILTAAREVGAFSIVDGAQLVPHAPVDVTRLGADALVFSGHKMLGPTGIGVVWARSERLEEIEPVEHGGDMIADVTLHGATWAQIPHRFEAGTPPIMEVIGLGAAIDYLDKIGLSSIAAHDRALTEYALDALASVPALEIEGPSDPDGRGGVISFTMGDIHAHDVATILDQHGVAVRAGHHCAKPLMRILGVPATARASFYLYTETRDIDALVEALGEAGRLFGVQ
ncbi:MAG TPA: SufS family cysteine desulfurase [Acidimicrobiia bacterium]|nr:SufS family cysteine desulfurase [Acidimicrobiia bacterium]